MKKNLTRVILFTGILLLSNVAIAGSPRINKDDTLYTVLTAQKGNLVTVKLASGDELTGKVGDTTGKLVVLQSLTGKEYFDAVIDIESIAAVIVRTKE